MILDQHRSDVDPTLKLHLMGTLAIELDGKPLDNLASRTVTAILIYLLAHQRPVPRDTLADFFWDDRSQAQASANLRAALSRLRKHLGDYLLITRHTAGVDHRRGDYFVDAFAIESILQQELAREQPAIPALEQALTWYKGDFLAGFHLNESRGFEAWMVVQRERLRHLAAQALALVSERHLHEGNYAQALTFTQQWVAVDPLDERPRRQLMRLHMRAGKRHAALQQFQTMRQLLEDELGVEPEPASLALFQRFRSLPDAPVINLPHLVTPMLGREEELTRVVHSVREDARTLVTILGPGGMGKTTLAIESAQQLAQNPTNTFLDGIFFIPLAGLPSSDLLADAIAAGLGLNLQSVRDPEAHLADYLSSREMLLVLDNFEHLLDGRGRQILERLLSRAPDLRVIATSRRRLGLDAEWILQPRGLAFPPAKDTPDAARYPAVQLYLHHARRLHPGFEPNDQDLQAIIEICQLVQGMPLGLELAAGWTQLYHCGDIRDRIRQNLDLLDGGQVDELGRPRSLRAAFDSVWAALPREEQRALRRMAVFGGPFTIEAAERVAAADPLLLQNLVNRTLLRKDEDNLWSLHSLFQQYCQEKLDKDAGDLDSARRRHAEHYMGLMAQVAASLRQARRKGQRAEDMTRRFEREIDNIRAATERLLNEPHLSSSGRITQFIDDFGHFLFYKSWYHEAERLFGQALARVEVDDLIRGRWQRELARTQLGLGRPQQATKRFLQALTSLEQPVPPTARRKLQWGLLTQLLRQVRYRLLKTPTPLSDPDRQQALEAIHTYDSLSRAYYYAGQPQAFGYCALRSLNLAEQARAPAAQARGYANLSLMLGLLGRHGWAHSYGERARHMAAGLDDVEALAYVHLVTGVYDGLMGVWQRSDESLQRAMQTYLQLGEMQPWGEGFSVWCTNLYAQGRFQETARQRQFLIETARAVGNDLHEAWGLSGRAAALLVLDRPGAARALLQQAMRKLTALNSPQNSLSAQALMGQAHLRLGEFQQAYNLANAVMTRKDATAPTFATNVAVYESVAIIYLDLLQLPPKQQAAMGVSPQRLLSRIDHISAALLQFARVARMGLPRAQIYRGLTLWQQGKTGPAFKLWRRAIASARELAMPYDEARAQFELGRHLPFAAEERQALLAVALQSFEAMAASYDARLTRTALA